MPKRKRLLYVLAFIAVLAAGWIAFYLYIQQFDSTIKVEPIPYEKPIAVNEFDNEYDVVVIGGEPEGVVAAVSAARNGANTLLIESREELGGLFTYGLFNSLEIPRDEEGNTMSRGIFEEWHNLVGASDVFGIEQAKAAFKKLVDEEPLLTLSVNTEVVQPIMEENTVIGVQVKNEFGEFKIKGKAFIDATQDADFAAMSKVPFFIGREDIGNKEKNQTVDFIIHLNDVNWDQVLEAVSSEKFGPAEHTNNEAWGFPQLQEEYIPVEENTQLRGFNIVKIENDYYLSGLQIVGVNGLDVESKQQAIEKGKIETENILAFLQGNFPGFEQAKIAGYPTELYISETRHILAEYQLTMIDVWTNRDQWDNIGLGAYPAKVQALTPQDQSYVIAKPKQYAIPFRSLVPKELDGLLVVGRSAGFSSLAASSARVVPTGMVTGEAAGVAAAIVTGQDLSFRELSKNEQLVEYLRTLLAEQGAIVDNFESDYPYQGEWYDESIQILINYGLVYGGYTNDLEVDELATRHRFINLLKDSIIVGNPELDKALQAKLDSILANELTKEDGPLLLDDITNILSVLFIDSKTTSSWQKLIDQNIRREEISANIPTEVHELTNKEIYAICAEVFNYIHQ